MSKPTLPQPPIPRPMTGQDKTSWAYDTVIRRWPEIIDRIFKENDLPAPFVSRLAALKSEIPNTPISMIDDPAPPDSADWQAYITPYQGKDWLAPPWFFCEHYLYRRIMTALEYFQTPDTPDPFSYQKMQGLVVARQTIADRAHLLNRAVDAPVSTEVLASLIQQDLWGNQADLSLWPAEGEDKPEHADQHAADAYLLADDIQGAAQHIIQSASPKSTIDFLVDNAGIELVGDLMLADYLLSQKLTSTVRLHLKPHPTYVSDAMIKDVIATIDFLEAEPHEAVQQFGARLRKAAQTQQLVLIDNHFWTSPLSGWEMPDSLRRTLSNATLVISKGDAHYRRLLGDRDWPFETRFADIVRYFPAPLLALRTLKAELACGLNPGDKEKLFAKDPHWLTNGRWGVAQFVNTPLL